LQLVKETIPRISRLAVLWNPDTASHARAIEELKAAAPSLRIELNFISARTPEEFGTVISAATRAHAQALYVLDDAFFAKNRERIFALAFDSRLPVIGDRSFAETGALVYYGPSFGDVYRRSAGYVDKILKGAKPADLPIEQPTKFELVVNLKTAKSLGITIP